jgi:hypothetical protein
MDIQQFVEDWKLMKSELQRQLAAFGSSMHLYTQTRRRDTMEELKEHVRRCIAELDELLREHEAA